MLQSVHLIVHLYHVIFDHAILLPVPPFLTRYVRMITAEAAKLFFPWMSLDHRFHRIYVHIENSS